MAEHIGTPAIDHPSSRSKRRRLVMGEREPILRPDEPQEVGLISSALRAVFNDLVGGRRDWPLYLWGDTGRGKTSAALCLLNRVQNSAWVDEEQSIQAVYNREAAFWHYPAKALLLVVEEFGLRSKIEAREKLAAEKLAAARLWLPTVWLSNLPPSREQDKEATGQRRPGVAELYGDRIYSRLCSSTVVHLGGPDRRFQRAGDDR